VPRADPEIWNRTVANLKKARPTGRNKERIHLSKSARAQQPSSISPEDVKASWDPGLKFLKTILQSELVDQEKMKNFDGRLFLDGTGAQALCTSPCSVPRFEKRSPETN
jgi:hypothetical protein